MLYLCIFSWYFGVVTSQKILFLCISTSSLSCLVCHVIKILFQNEAGKNLVMYSIKTNKPGKLASYFNRKSKGRF